MEENTMDNARQALMNGLTNLENPNQEPGQPIPEVQPPVEQVDTSVQETPQQKQVPQFDPQTIAMAAIEAQRRENAMLKQQLQQIQQANQEVQQTSEETVMQTLTAPIFPQYEYDAASDEERQQIAGKYSQDMEQYYSSMANKAIDDRIKPIEQYYRQQTSQAEENNVINGIIRSNQFPDFQEMLPEIRKTMESIPDLQKIPVQNRIPLAYYLLKGHKGTAPAAQETAEQLLKKVESNPDVIKALKAKEIMSAKENSDIPSHVTSGGISNAAAAMPTAPPENLDAVKENIMKTRFKNGQYVGRG